MTPEELYGKIRILEQNGESYSFSKTVERYSQYLELFEQAKSEWCKKQREYCAGEITKDSYECTIKENRERILNAPEP